MRKVPVSVAPGCKTLMAVRIRIARLGRRGFCVAGMPFTAMEGDVRVRKRGENDEMEK